MKEPNIMPENYKKNLKTYLKDRENNSKELKEFIGGLLKRKKASLLEENNLPEGFINSRFGGQTQIKTLTDSHYKKFGCCEYIYNDHKFSKGSENRLRFIVSAKPGIAIYRSRSDRDKKLLMSIKGNFLKACKILRVSCNENEIDNKILELIRNESIEIYLSFFNENIKDVRFTYNGEEILVETGSWLSDLEFKSLVFISRFAERSSRFYLFLCLLVILREKYKKSNLYDIFQMASISVLSGSILPDKSVFINKSIHGKRKKKAIELLKKYLSSQFKPGYFNFYSIYDSSTFFSPSVPFYHLSSSFYLKNIKEIKDSLLKINDPNHRSLVTNINGFFDSIFVKTSKTGMIGLDIKDEEEMEAFSEYLFYLRKGFNLSALNCLRNSKLKSRDIIYYKKQNN